MAYFNGGDPLTTYPSWGPILQVPLVHPSLLEHLTPMLRQEAPPTVVIDRRTSKDSQMDFVGILPGAMPSWSHLTVWVYEIFFQSRRIFLHNSWKLTEVCQQIVLLPQKRAGVAPCSLSVSPRDCGDCRSIIAIGVFRNALILRWTSFKEGPSHFAFCI